MTTIRIVNTEKRTSLYFGSKSLFDSIKFMKLHKKLKYSKHIYKKLKLILV